MAEEKRSVSQVSASAEAIVSGRAVGLVHIEHGGRNRARSGQQGMVRGEPTLTCPFHLLVGPGMVLVSGDGSGDEKGLSDSRDHREHCPVREDSYVRLEFNVAESGLE